MIGEEIEKLESIRKIYSEQHYSLLFTWKIKLGITNNIEKQRIGKYVRYFWEEYLSGYFEIMEKYLFTGLDGPMIARSVNDHLKIGKMITAMDTRTEFRDGDCLELADLIRNNIRYEQEALFPYLKNKLTEVELESRGIRISIAHSRFRQENYPDKFWITDRRT